LRGPENSIWIFKISKITTGDKTRKTYITYRYGFYLYLTFNFVAQKQINARYIKPLWHAEQESSKVL